MLHETTSDHDGGREQRRTIALAGSSSDGDRFWLGATSRDAGPVDRLELVGDLPDFAAPVLAQVLLALRSAAPR